MLHVKKSTHKDTLDHLTNTRNQFAAIGEWANAEGKMKLLNVVILLLTFVLLFNGNKI